MRKGSGEMAQLWDILLFPNTRLQCPALTLLSPQLPLTHAPADLMIFSSAQRGYCTYVHICMLIHRIICIIKNEKDFRI